MVASTEMIDCGEYMTYGMGVGAGDDDICLDRG